MVALLCYLYRETGDWKCPFVAFDHALVLSDARSQRVCVHGGEEIPRLNHVGALSSTCIYSKDTACA